MKKWKIDRIISVATLVTSVIALFLVLKKPAPVAEPQPAATAVANAQSFQEKVQQLDQPKEAGQPPAEVRLSSNEVSAALAQAAGQIPLGATAEAMSGLASSGRAPGMAPDAAVAPGQPEVKDYQVSFDGDVAHDPGRGKVATGRVGLEQQHACSGIAKAHEIIAAGGVGSLSRRSTGKGSHEDHGSGRGCEDRNDSGCRA